MLSQFVCFMIVLCTFLFFLSFLLSAFLTLFRERQPPNGGCQEPYLAEYDRKGSLRFPWHRYLLEVPTLRNLSRGGRARHLAIAFQKPRELPHWFIWPFKRVLKGFKRLLKGFLAIFTRKFVQKIDRKLIEKRVKNIQKTSLKLFPSNPKLQINQPDETG